MTAFYSVLHLFVDGVCAVAMFGKFAVQEKGGFYLLLYNFCAFALQMPLGAFLDTANVCKKGAAWDVPYAVAMAGVCLTLAGAVMHPAILGVGNALFHVGGGLGTIREDRDFGWRGRGLGIFVAPGAFGLYLGTLFAKSGTGISAGAAAGMLACLCAGMAFARKHLHPAHFKRDQKNAAAFDGGAGRLCLAFCCFAVVIVRCYVGLAVSFPWKNTPLAGLLAVLAVVGGKIAGGFLAARFGCFKTAVVSLALSAACYLVSGNCPAGLAALFLFNMTMPVTLCLLIRAYSQISGFAFGLLTFALFLGYLPVYFGWQPGIGGAVIGCAGSIASLLLLSFGIWGERRNGHGFSD